MAPPLRLSGRFIIAGDPDASILNDKSVLITGGASGLGAAVAKKFAENGAYVTIADLNEDLGNSYIAELKGQGLKVNFVHTDVTSWVSQVAAFKSAIAFSPSKAAIDVVVAGAGLFGRPFLLPKEEPASLNKDPEPPSTNDITVNLIGPTYTAKLAHHYFSLPPVLTAPISPPISPTSPRSFSSMSWSAPSEWSKVLVIIGSSGGYLEVPLQATYNASKWGVRGLFRTIREPLAKEGLRVNLIAPWLLDTPMSKEALPAFQAAGLPVGQLEDVITAITHCVVNNGITGRAFVVGPKKIVDLGDDEEGCDGGLVMKNYVRLQLPGYTDKVAKLMKMMGFSYKVDIGDLLQAL